MRSTQVAIALGLSLAFMLQPALAQQGASESSDKTLQQAQSALDQLSAAINSKNPDNAAAMFTSDAVIVAPTGHAFIGSSSTHDYYGLMIKAIGDGHITETAKQAHTLGRGIWVTAESVFQPSNAHSHIAVVLVPENKKWKVQMLSVGNDVALGTSSAAAR